jgi:hypothetical protein
MTNKPKLTKEQKIQAFVKLFMKHLDEKQIRNIRQAFNNAIDNSLVIDKKQTNKKEN